MKHSIVLKFIAILLAACALVAAAGSAIGIALLGSMGLYSMDYTDWQQEQLDLRANSLAYQVADRYAAQTLSDCPESVLAQTSSHYSDDSLSVLYDLPVDSWAYSILDTDGKQLESTYSQALDHSYTYRLTVNYPVLSTENNYDYYVYDDSSKYYIRYAASPELVVMVTLAADAITGYEDIPLEQIRLAFDLRYGAAVILAASLLIFAICTVYLCCAAGKSSRDSKPLPGGLNRLPLDLYAAVAGPACVLLVMLSNAIMSAWFYDGAGYNMGAVVLAGVALLVAAVIGMGFLFAVAAQFKMRHFYWWRHSVIGWCCGRIWRGIRFVFSGLCKLFRLLPLIWQYLLIGAAMGFFPLFFFFLAAVGRSYWLFVLFLSILCDVIIVCYGAYAYGTLLKGAKRMAEGSLHTKISTKYLLGSFKTCAEHLNALADVSTVAAKQQMKSERMKTELITNVSHDIKTPLTSIINYVDLLEKPHTQEEGVQYLEVLGRQSQRLKKLIEDLMEMSKATTGNMAVDITQVDAAEAVNQALGEFSDKLAAAHLIPVFRQPEQTVAMRADGRLTWRVMSNLLSNIVKYALPGTRVYIDLVRLEGQVLISLKNISREELNVSADELTERFVRGDASRNTEGSGLGLNIAKSLMELQKGQLQLLVDGDLFKVTLVFPAG